MIIVKKRYSLSKKIHLLIKNNIFSSLTKNQIERIKKLINLEQNRGYSVSLSSYDWRICLIEKQLNPTLKITLLLPDLILDPEYSIPKNSFYSKYKQEYFSKNGLYGDDCDWFFSFNPRRYNVDLATIKYATKAEQVKIVKSCKKTHSKISLTGLTFLSYVDYSNKSRDMQYATWSYKYKSHLVSMADYFQFEEIVHNSYMKKVFHKIIEAAIDTEKETNKTHGQSVKSFYYKLREIDSLPNVENLKELWTHPIAMNKISDIYFTQKNTENFLKSKRIELNNLLNIHVGNPEKLTEKTLLNALYSHLIKEASLFRTRNEQDKKFSKLVKDKSIAIVGSASADLTQGKDIDAFDLVARMNFPIDNSDNGLYSGKRTDILYKSTSIMKNVKSLSSIESDQIFYNYLSIIPAREKKTHARTTYELSNNLLSMPHSVPRSIIDLMSFEPSKIKIFNCTLYACVNSIGLYDKQYSDKITSLRIKNPSSTQEEKLMTNFFHDFSLNFLIMKSLYLNNIFEADASLIKVLDMSLEEYINNLFIN